MVLAWADGEDIMTSLRETSTYATPAVYTGDASLSLIETGCYVNSTHVAATFVCASCVGTDYSFEASATETVFGWAWSDSDPTTPSDAETALTYHSAGYGEFEMLLSDAQTADYATWAATASGSATESSGNSTTTSGSGSNSTTTVTYSNTTYDYIVVGGGTAGLIVAERLAEAGGSVLVIEKGGKSTFSSGNTDTLPWNDTITSYDLPALASSMSTIATTFCDDTAGMAGCLLGGSSEVNAMMFVRPQPCDFDDKWPTGWKWTDMEAAAERLYERNPGTILPSENGQYYDQDIYTAMSGFLSSLGWSSVNALEEPAAKYQAYSHPPWSIQNAQRAGPVKTYLPLAEELDNFSLQLNTEVTRVVRNGSAITGVEISKSDGSLEIISLTTEGKVILAAGTFTSARLLIQSGIGPTEQIQTIQSSSLDIALPDESEWINLPVGVQVMDHPILTITLNSSTELDSFYNFTSLPTSVNGTLEDLYSAGSGILAQGGQRINFWTNINGTDGVTRYIQGTVSAASATQIKVKIYLTHGLTSVGAIGVTAQGTTEITTTPYFNTEGDKEAMTTFLNYLGDAASAANSTLTINGNYSLEYLVESISEGDHYVGSCKMGTDSGLENGTAVVDTSLLVYGTDNLYVVDGSVHPDLPTGNSQAIIMVVAEAAAAKIAGVETTISGSTGSSSTSTSSSGASSESSSASSSSSSSSESSSSSSSSSGSSSGSESGSGSGSADTSSVVSADSGSAETITQYETTTVTAYVTTVITTVSNGQTLLITTSVPASTAVAVSAVATGAATTTLTTQYSTETSTSYTISTYTSKGRGGQTFTHTTKVPCGTTIKLHPTKTAIATVVASSAKGDSGNGGETVYITEYVTNVETIYATSTFLSTSNGQEVTITSAVPVGTSLVTSVSVAPQVNAASASSVIVDAATAAAGNAEVTVTVYATNYETVFATSTVTTVSEGVTLTYTTTEAVSSTLVSSANVVTATAATAAAAGETITATVYVTAYSTVYNTVTLTTTNAAGAPTTLTTSVPVSTTAVTSASVITTTAGASSSVVAAIGAASSPAGEAVQVTITEYVTQTQTSLATSTVVSEGITKTITVPVTITTAIPTTITAQAVASAGAAGEVQVTVTEYITMTQTSFSTSTVVSAGVTSTITVPVTSTVVIPTTITTQVVASATAAGAAGEVEVTITDYVTQTETSLVTSTIVSAGVTKTVTVPVTTTVVVPTTITTEVAASAAASVAVAAAAGSVVTLTDTVTLTYTAYTTDIVATTVAGSTITITTTIPVLATTTTTVLATSTVAATTGALTTTEEVETLTVTIMTTDFITTTVSGVATTVAATSAVATAKVTTTITEVLTVSETATLTVTQVSIGTVLPSASAFPQASAGNSSTWHYNGTYLSGAGSKNTTVSGATGLNITSSSSSTGFNSTLGYNATLSGASSFNGSLPMNTTTGFNATISGASKFNSTSFANATAAGNNTLSGISFNATSATGSKPMSTGGYYFSASATGSKPLSTGTGSFSTTNATLAGVNGTKPMISASSFIARPSSSAAASFFPSSSAIISSAAPSTTAAPFSSTIAPFSPSSTVIPSFASSFIAAPSSSTVAASTTTVAPVANAAPADASSSAVASSTATTSSKACSSSAAALKRREASRRSGAEYKQPEVFAGKRLRRNAAAAMQ